jgi:hypothetical protein
MGTCISKDHTSYIIKSNLLVHDDVETKTRIENDLKSVKEHIEQLRGLERRKVQLVKEELSNRRIEHAKWQLCQAKFFRLQVDMSQRSYDDLDVEFERLKQDHKYMALSNLSEKVNGIYYSLKNDMNVDFLRGLVREDVSEADDRIQTATQKQQRIIIAEFLHRNYIDEGIFNSQLNREIDIITRGLGLNALDHLPSPYVNMSVDIIN